MTALFTWGFLAPEMDRLRSARGNSRREAAKLERYETSNNRPRRETALGDELFLRVLTLQFRKLDGTDAFERHNNC